MSMFNTSRTHQNVSFSTVVSETTSLNFLVFHFSTKAELAETSSAPQQSSNILLSTRVREINANVIGSDE